MSGEALSDDYDLRGLNCPLPVLKTQKRMRAMAAGERVVLEQVGLFADGVAVAQIGQHTFDICREHVDEVITVSTDEICAAIKDIYDDTRSITEPAGALAVAGGLLSGVVLAWWRSTRRCGNCAPSTWPAPWGPRC